MNAAALKSFRSFFPALAVALLSAGGALLLYSKVTGSSHGKCFLLVSTVILGTAGADGVKRDEGV